jgi:hypothetical protein
MSNVPSVPENYDAVRAEIIELLQAARRVAARSINSLMTATYWEIGRRIVQYEQKGEARADYGQRLVEQLANDLSRQFGRGFGRANLWQMRAFYRAWPEPKILQTASGESLTAPSFNNADVLASSIRPGGALPAHLVCLRPPAARRGSGADTQTFHFKTASADNLLTWFFFGKKGVEFVLCPLLLI